MTDQIIQSIKETVNYLQTDERWKSIKPYTPRQSEYLAQARADLVRCVGNLERAERCEGEK